MIEHDPTARLETLRRALPALYGCVLTLLVTVVLGDLRYFSGEAPVGWFVLWGLTTLAGVPTGIYLLWKRPWGAVPLKVRRGTAVGYLMVGFVNLVGLGFFSLNDAGVLCLLAPIPYAALLGLVYLRAFWLEDRDGGEVFP